MNTRTFLLDYLRASDLYKNSPVFRQALEVVWSQLHQRLV